MRRGWLFLIVSFVLSGILASCGSTVAAPLALNEPIVAVGSTSLQPLVSAAAAQFQKQYQQVKIKVSGGDSRVGLDAVNTQQADIGNSDIYADPALYPNPDLTDHIVCIVPDALIVNPDVPVSSLTQQQIIDIFSNEKITNWNQVGGPNMPIARVVQGTASGTRNIFRKYILGGLNETGNILQATDSVSERDLVAQTPGAIGYLALSVLTPQVNAIAIDGQTPSEANIAAGRYAFWSYEHMYTLGTTNSTISEFLKFMLTSAIQQQARQMGYLPSSVMMQT